MKRVLTPLLVLFLAGCSTITHNQRVALKNGQIHINGKTVFLKIAKVLRRFDHASDIEKLEKDLPIIREKGYNMVEFSIYWDQFDKDGDGQLEDAPVESLRHIIAVARKQGFLVGLSTEIYGVGGGTVPAGLFDRNPDIVAINSEGYPVSDTEYGFGTMVPSLYAPAFLETSRAFIRNLAAAVDSDEVFWYETSVEPQYIGNQSIDYSVHARQQYEAWLSRNGIPGPAWPESFPIPQSFQHDPTWNRFRAEWLAEWVNGDAAAFRSVAGDHVLIAVDYLETGGPEMWRRNGDSRTFLRNLTCANVIQVNWHWHLGTRSPNTIAYENLRAVMDETQRDWAISEHMTINGSDYFVEEMPALLRNTLEQGTLLGWEFVNVAARTADPFSLYNDDWSPKPTMAQVDLYWDAWMDEVSKERQKQRQ